MTYITQPILPDKEAYIQQISKLWDSRHLTNNGENAKALESELAEHLGVEHTSLFCNGTIALLTALKSLDLSGEVITTPFTFPASNTVLEWLNLTPVFCDITTDTLCIDPYKIEKLITPKTSAILGVHVYGNPCNTTEISKIAKKHNLKVIYDSAHAFGSKYNSLYKAGDVSMLSFHSTKLFHTIEGGAVISNDKKLQHKINLLRNFGIENQESVIYPGINGKVNEFQAIMGRLNLKNIKTEMTKRLEVARQYHEKLPSIEGVKIVTPVDNYHYFIVQITPEKSGFTRDTLYSDLEAKGIYSRKYFYPLCSNYPFYSDNKSAQKGILPIANKVANEVLALPFYGDLSLSVITTITNVISTLQEE